MSRGGRRPGAGRPRGSKNKRTVAKVTLLPARVHRQAVEELPLDVLLKAMRDPNHPIELRLAAAARAAPYFHAKVSGGPPKASFEMRGQALRHARQGVEDPLLRNID